LLTSGREIDDRRGLLDDERVTGIQIIRESVCVLHAGYTSRAGDKFQGA
jgi:hypothetical protein